MKRFLILATLFVASSAFAQVAIDQNKAMAGGITPGDTPGFPITISLPGSYKLTSNLVVPAGTSGIHVLTGLVTGSRARNNGGNGIFATYVQESLSSGNAVYGAQAVGARGVLSMDNGVGQFGNGTKSMGANLNQNQSW